MEHKDNLSFTTRFKRRLLKEEETSDNSETNEESNMSLSELRVKLSEDSVHEWKNKLEDDTSSKTLSPSAMSSDTSSVHSGRFDTDYDVGQRVEVKDYRTDTW